jgi:chaperone modulatory protein CbpM
MENRQVISFRNDEFFKLSLSEFCKACDVNADDVLKYIDYSVIEPPFEGGEWRFNSICIRRVQQAGRLQRDLGINPAGLALALDLLEELERLRGRLHHYER